MLDEKTLLSIPNWIREIRARKEREQLVQGQRLWLLNSARSLQRELHVLANAGPPPHRVERVREAEPVVRKKSPGTFRASRGPGGNKSRVAVRADLGSKKATAKPRCLSVTPSRRTQTPAELCFHTGNVPIAPQQIIQAPTQPLRPLLYVNVVRSRSRMETARPRNSTTGSSRALRRLKTVVLGDRWDDEAGCGGEGLRPLSMNVL